MALALTGALAGVPQAAVIEEIAVPGIDNFSMLAETSGFAGSPAAFGGATQAAAMPWLHEQGFAAVVNLRFSSEEGADIDNSRATAEAAGLNYFSMPFNPEQLNAEYLENFWAVIGDPANQPVYIHCQSATRVAVLWMITRVLKDGWDTDAASIEAQVIAAKPEKAVAVATQYLESVGK